MSKVYIPKNRKKVRKITKNFSKIVIDFEAKVAKKYNNGEIKYPIHLTKP